MLRLFDFKCTSCGTVAEHIVEAEMEIRKCVDCVEGTMERLPPIFRVNMGPVGSPYGGWNDTLQKYIRTNKQHREECAKQGVTPKGDTPKPNGQAWV